jgi:hypothetical protein
MSNFLPLPGFQADFFVVIVGLCLALALTILAALSFADTKRGQRIQRDHLGKRLAGSRMWSMLEHRGIAPLKYVDQNEITSLRDQIKTCEHCAKQDLCDETLEYRGTRKRNYGFCANRKAIDQFVASSPEAPLH